MWEHLCSSFLGIVLRCQMLVCWKALWVRFLFFLNARIAPFTLDPSCRRPYTYDITWMRTLYVGHIMDAYPIRWVYPGYTYILDFYFPHLLYPGWAYVGYILYVQNFSWIYTLHTGYIPQKPLYIWYILGLYMCTPWACSFHTGHILDVYSARWV